MADPYLYRPFLLRQVTGSAPVAFGTDTVRIMLVTSSYIPDYDADDFLDDVSADELANGDGYTSGGVTLANVGSSITGDVASVTADDASWTFTASKTFRFAVLHKWTGTAGTSPLIGAYDFGAGGRTELGQYDITFDTGFLKLTAIT